MVKYEKHAFCHDIELPQLLKFKKSHFTHHPQALKKRSSENAITNKERSSYIRKTLYNVGETQLLI